ncbi:uncharacterized protein LOC142615944 [Castanea sativa]|uniref:uncharacterized protein LOC142615944 n=1 Tax=Castanea sativa TaxID=21020 RepID=UPI003F64A1C3
MFHSIVYRVLSCAADVTDCTQKVQTLRYAEETCYNGRLIIKAFSSVLIPINRLGTLLQLLEQISASLESSTLKVPIYVISSIAEELLAYTNVIPECLCKERQEKESLAQSHGSQCGFCTPGFIMSMYALLRSCQIPPSEVEGTTFCV